jgi:two-component system, OmpR family, sensor histidine kinase MprB
VSLRTRLATLSGRRLTLRSRLTVITALAVAIVVVTVSVSCWWLIRIRLYQQLDSQLRSDAQTAMRAAGPADAVRALLAAGDQRSDWRNDEGYPAVIVRYLNTAGNPTMASSGADALGPVDPAAKQIAAHGSGSEAENVGPAEHVYRVSTEPTPGGAVQVARRVGGIEDTLVNLGALLTAIGFAGAAGAGLVGWTVARAGLRPVHLLTGAVEKVARTQNLGGRIPVRGRDEVARLAEAFNELLEALGASRAAQQQLVQDAEHELRTPLTSLRNNIELLIHAEGERSSGKVLSSEDRARLLTDLGVQAAELTTLTTELVELAGENADPEPFEPVDLAELVVAAVDRARVRWPKVVFDVSTTPAKRAGQPTALERAVLNLVDNAAKWSPPAGTVHIRLQTETVHDGQTAELIVTDEGPGIAEQDRPKVFERFYRATSARSMPGSGLGLAIVAQTVAAHEGTVSVEQAPGGGAQLRVRL